MRREDGRDPADLVGQILNDRTESFVFARETVHLGLQLGQPGLFALTTFERGCKRGRSRLDMCCLNDRPTPDSPCLFLSKKFFRFSSSVSGFLSPLLPSSSSYPFMSPMSSSLSPNEFMKSGEGGSGAGAFFLLFFAAGLALVGGGASLDLRLLLALTPFFPPPEALALAPPTTGLGGSTCCSCSSRLLNS